MFLATGRFIEKLIFPVGYYESNATAEAVRCETESLLKIVKE